MPKIPTIKRVEITHSLLGKVEIRFECPRCKQRLKCSREEIGVPDNCPHCSHRFMISGLVERKLREEEEEKERAKLEAKELKEAENRRRREEAERFMVEGPTSMQAAEEDDDEEMKTNESDESGYSALELVASWYRISGYVSLYIAAFVFLIFSMIFVSTATEGEFAKAFSLFGVGLMIVFMSLIIAMFSIATSEAIKLAINIAEDVRAIRLVTEESREG